LTRWNGARSRTAWVRGRLARIQQCDPSRDRGHRALGCPTRAGRHRSVANRGVARSFRDVPDVLEWCAFSHRLGARASRPQTAVCRLLGARASCPRSPHEGGTPAWGCGRLVRRQQCDPSRARGHRALGRLTRAGRPPGSAGVSPADSSVTHHGSAGILGARASRPQTAVCRLLGARASRPGSPHEGGTPAWVRGRLARTQQCDPSRERGHRALGRLTRVGRPPGCAGVAPAYSSRPITGARASCPRPPHEGGTPAWVRGRLARRQQCDASRARGHRALGRLTRAERPPGCAGVSPADSSVDASRDMVRVLAPPGCAGVSPA